METFNFKNYRIERDEKMIGGQMKPVFRAFRATPKGKFSKEKMVAGYYYGNVENREKAINDFMQNISNQENEKEARKQKKAAAKANMVNPFKVGDIVYDSWGYDQTNIDWYQVVEVGVKSVKIQEIGGKMEAKDGYNDMSGFTSPIKDSFVEGSEPIQKNLQVLPDGTVYIKSRHGWISPWNGQPKYTSWYA